MLNAAEAAMDMSAQDDAERQKNRAKLYAPPKGVRMGPGRRMRPPGAAMNRAQAQNLVAQLAAQDAQLGQASSG